MGTIDRLNKKINNVTTLATSKKPTAKKRDPYLFTMFLTYLSTELLSTAETMAEIAIIMYVDGLY